MAKYCLEFKIKLIKEYLDGKSGGVNLVASKYEVPYKILNNWIIRFNANGIKWLRKKQEISQ